MCDPTGGFLIAGLAISVLATGASYEAADQQARQQHNYAQSQMDATTRNAQTAYSASVEQTNSRLKQTTMQNSQELQQEQSQAQKVEAQAQVSSGEAGVSGLSIDNLMNDYKRQDSIYNAAVNQNQEWSRDQYGYDVLGLGSQFANRVNSASTGPISRPSLLAYGAQLGGDVAQAGTSYARYGGGGSSSSSGSSAPPKKQSTSGVV